MNEGEDLTKPAQAVADAAAEATPPQSAPPQAAPGGTPPQQKKGKGCFFWGCTSSLVILVVIIISVTATYFYVKRQFAPSPIEPVELSLEEKQVLDHKVNAIKGLGSDSTTVADGQPLEADVNTNRFVLTERELNGLLADNEEWAESMSIDLSDDHLNLRVNFTIPEDAGKWANKQVRLGGSIKAEMRDGELFLGLTRLTIGALPVPSAWINGLTGGIMQKNLVDEIFTDQKMKDQFLAGIKHFEITDDEIIFVPNE